MKFNVVCIISYGILCVLLLGVDHFSNVLSHHVALYKNDHSMYFSLSLCTSLCYFALLSLCTFLSLHFSLFAPLSTLLSLFLCTSFSLFALLSIFLHFSLLTLLSLSLSLRFSLSFSLYTPLSLHFSRSHSLFPLSLSPSLCLCYKNATSLPVPEGLLKHHHSRRP